MKLLLFLTGIKFIPTFIIYIISVQSSISTLINKRRVTEDVIYLSYHPCIEIVVEYFLEYKGSNRIQEKHLYIKIINISKTPIMVLRL